MTEIIEYSVSEISFAIKKCVETTFDKVRIRGEIFGAKRADSGHWYLSLKDENAVISAVCWRGVASSLAFKPEDGMEIIATGKITTFAGKSSYQLIIEQMEIAGTGALLKLLEERKKKFADMGYFDAAHKKKIPYLPQTIGVITSASGAVIRDIIHRIRDRFPSHILLLPTPVQGQGAAEKIAESIKKFNIFPQNGLPRPDVLIVARGGGSLEDLWPFNEEVVINAVYASEIPIISAVGHETDTMLIDYVADLRAPTPTGAAEFSVPVLTELKSHMLTRSNRLFDAIHRYFSELKTQIDGLGRGIPNLEQILAESRQKFDDRSERLNIAFSSLLNTKKQMLATCRLQPFLIVNMIERKSENLNSIGERLKAVSIESVLKRGFAWVKDEYGRTVYTAKEAKKQKYLTIGFTDDNVKTKIIGKKDDLQGDLFD